MVSNPFNEQKKCFQWLDKILNTLPPGGMLEEGLVIECLKIFAVSESSVRKCIERYINIESITREHGMLERKKK